MHFASFYERFGILPTCWSTERKHRYPKKWVNNVTNTKVAFDTNAFREVTAHHNHSLGEDTATGWIGLLPPLVTPPIQTLAILYPLFGSASFQTARSARVSDFEVVRVGDVVEGWNGSTDFLGKVLVHVLVDDTACFTVLETWKNLEANRRFSKWDARAPTRLLVHSTDIVTACIYAAHGGCVTVLRGGRSRRPAPRAA